MTARRSLVASLAQKYSVLAIRLVSLIVLSRLLGPRDLGVFVAASAIIALAHVVADCGVHQFIIQKRELSHETQRAALGAGIITAAIAALAVVSFSLLAPASMVDDNLRTGIQILALSFLTYPFTTLSTGVLQRALRFGELYWIATAAVAASVAVSIVLALLGFGFLSLVWGTIAEAVVTSALVFRLHAPVWPSLVGWRPIFSFGWVWTIFNGVKEGADSLARLTVGLTLGYTSVGLLARAQNVLLLFDKALMDALGMVLLPALSQRLRNGGEIAAMHLRMVSYLAATAWPFFAVLALCADPLVRLLLGPEWTGTITPVRILCIGGFFLPFSAMLLQFFVALECLHEFLPRQAVIQVTKALAVVAAAQVSLEAVCLALVLEPAMKAWLGHHLLTRRLAVKTEVYLAPVLSSAISTLAAAAGAVSALQAVGDAAPPAALLAIAAAAAFPPWVIVLVVLKHPLIDELRHLREFVRARRMAINGLD